MKLRITVEGKTYEVDVEVLDNGGTAANPSPPVSGSISPTPQAPKPVAAPSPSALPPRPAADSSSERVVKAPIVGTILKLLVAPGDTVELNQVLVVMEAMKMETNIASPLAGKVKDVLVSPGESVKAGQRLVELE